MKVTIKTPDGKEIISTKGKASSDLFIYILSHCPNEAQIIRNGMKEVKDLKTKIREIRTQVEEKTGYRLAGF